jgi:hypothetical protein
MDVLQKELVNDVHDSHELIGPDGICTQPNNADYWTNFISQLDRKHQEDVNRNREQFSERFANAMESKRIEYEQKLGEKESIHESVVVCIQDELDSERHHALTLQTNHALTIQAYHENQERATAMISELQTNHALTIQAYHENQERATAMISELQSRLSLFYQIDAAKSLANHTAEMLHHIDNMSFNMQKERPFDKRASLLVKDMKESLLLKTPENHEKLIFISEVMCRLGFRFTREELGRIGHPISTRFRSLTGEFPSKHAQFVDGHVTFVNSYTQASEFIIREELQKAWAKKQQHDGTMMMP